VRASTTAAWIVARRELGAYFATPFGFGIAAAFLVAEGLIFWTALTALSAPDAPNVSAIELYFGGNLYFWIAQLVFVPLATVRLLAGERQAGTLDLVLSCPISAAAIVLGKFAAAYVYYLALWAPTVVYVLFIAAHGEIDLGAVLSGYLGVAVVGAPLVAVALLASAVSASQAIAGAVAFAALLSLYGLSQLEGHVAPGATLHAWLDYASLSAAMADFGRGIVDSRRIAFPLSLAALALFFATRALEWRRLR
jgi:ABC-2 type transport system permease protein